MRLLSFEKDGRSSWGMLRGDEVIDLGARLGERYATLRDAIEQDALGKLASSAASTPADFPLSSIRYLPPIPNPRKIICVGVNYVNRNEEYRDGSDAPKYPSLFMRTPGSLVGHEAPILRPPESLQFDYEGEIALVIGRRGRRIPEAHAWDHIAGLSCLNEGSVRDWLRHGKFNVTQGKNFDRSGSFGPWLVTSDEFRDSPPLELSTHVNGERRQHDNTENLIFPFAYLIRYISSFTTLEAGDVIATGTPAGAGARFDPPRWLKPGDIVKVSVPGIGTLANIVADEVRS